MFARRTALGKLWRGAARGFCLALILSLIAGANSAAANGWEHATIPFDALLKALDFEEAATRTRAAQSLGFRGQKEAFEPLLRRLRRPEEDPGVRGAIYAAFGALGDRRAIPALVGCLETEQRQELRGDCVAALGRLAASETLPRLLTALREDSSILVRSRVVDALGDFSDDRAVTALSMLLSEGRNRSLRQRAIRALGRTGSDKAAKPLLAALESADSGREQTELVDALGLLGSAEAGGPLTELLRSTEDAPLRARIVVALGAIRDGSAYPTLVALLGDDVLAVRYFAVTALRDLGEAEAAGPINTLSLSISEKLQARTVTELFDDPLTTLADLSLQEVALRALTGLDAVEGLPAFLRAAPGRDLPRHSSTMLLIADAEYQTRRLALYGLGYTRSPEAATLLSGISGLGDPDFRLRATAVRSLGVLGFPRSAERLAAVLGDEAAEVRWTAASVLGRLGDARAVEPLIARLSDPIAEVRRQATLSLGYLGDARAREPLLGLAGADEDASVREAAAYAASLLSEPN